MKFKTRDKYTKRMVIEKAHDGWCVYSVISTPFGGQAKNFISRHETKKEAESAMSKYKMTSWWRKNGGR